MRPDNSGGMRPRKNRAGKNKAMISRSTPSKPRKHIMERGHERNKKLRRMPAAEHMDDTD